MKRGHGEPAGDVNRDVKTTKSGVRYVTTGDVLSSDSGRDLVVETTRRRVKSSYAEGALKREDAHGAAVRALNINALDNAVCEATGVREAVYDRTLALRALRELERRHPSRLEDFAQRLVDEVDPNNSGVHYSAIECGTYGAGGASGHELVVRILKATPVQICRAIILAMPERDT
jgi:hypothetical protein